MEVQEHLDSCRVDEWITGDLLIWGGGAAVDKKRRLRGSGRLLSAPV